MDRHRIGTFDATTGRFAALLDVNDGTNITLARDSFKVTPSQKQTIRAASTRRYGGTRPAGEIHDNGTLEATWLVAGATADLAFAQLKSLLELHEDATSVLYYEWRATGATRSTYYELRGGAPWNPDYRAVEFEGTRCLLVTGGWQIAPTAAGDPMDIVDDFSTDTITPGEWTQVAGAATISGGQMNWASASGTKLLRHTGRGYQPTDAQLTMRIRTPASVTGMGAGLVLRYLDSSNFLFAQQEQGNLRIYKSDGGASTQLATVAYTPSALTSYWVRFRAEGNVLYAEIFTSFYPASPTPLGTPDGASVSYTLTGGDATKFGAGIGGDVGMRLIFADTAFFVADFESKPYTYRRAGAQTLAAHTFDLYGIPGSAPAKVDAYTTSPAAVTVKSGLISWTRLPTSPAVGSVVPFGLLEGTGSADATSSGGSYHGGLTHTFTVDIGTLQPDDFTATISLELWGIIKANGTSGGTVGAVAYSLATEERLPILPPEFGAGAKSFRTASGRVITRLGTFTLESKTALTYQIQVILTGANVQGLDALLVAAAGQRACTATGQDTDDAQIWFDRDPTDEEVTKVIRTDLAGEVGRAFDFTAYGPHAGLSGQLLEFQPGDLRVLHRLGDSVVDSPDAASTEDLASSTMGVHYSVQPRYQLVREG